MQSTEKRGAHTDATRQMNRAFVNRCASGRVCEPSIASAMCTMATWAWLLRDYLEIQPIHTNHDQPSRGPAARFVPRLEDFPWYGKLKDGSKIPLPFMSKDDFDIKVDSKYRLVCWDDWLQDQAERMSHPLFLAESSWCGYWSFEQHRPYDPSAVEFASAIESISIHALHYVDFPVPNTRRLFGTYQDATVNIRLEGYITPQGQFKLGPPGEFWAWQGWCTPFGMWGLWGSADGARAAGATWLWPKSWTKETNKKRGAHGNDSDSDDAN